MIPVQADERVLGYLGRALSFEFSAVQLYSTQARLVHGWGLTEVAEKFKHEAAEEMGHADRIISRMLALGVSPSASQLRPVRLGQTLKQLLEYDYEFENELIGLYDQAWQHCASIRDSENRLFFEALLNEEREHAKALSEWLSSME
jgi:bacterioferritin